MFKRRRLTKAIKTYSSGMKKKTSIASICCENVLPSATLYAVVVIVINA